LRLKALVLVIGGLVAPVVTFSQQPAPGSAQPSVPVAPGTRVRVRASTLVAPLIANFLESRADTLLFFEEGAGRGIWSVPVDKLQRLERSVGHQSGHRPYILRGAAIGAGVGLAAGLIFAATLSPSDPEREYNRPLTGGVGALFGAGIGGLVGSRRKAEQWAEIRLPRRMTLRTDPRHVGLAVTF